MKAMVWNGRYTGDIVTPEQTAFELLCDDEYNVSILIKLKNTKHLLAACVLGPEHLREVAEFIRKVETARRAARKTV